MNNNVNNQTSFEKKQIEVKISNIKYNLTTTENVDYVKGIAKYINNKITEISINHKNIGINSIPFFITLALNIADDLFKQRKQFAKKSKSLKAMEQNISKINESNSLDLQNLKSDLEAKNSEILSLENKILSLNSTISSLEEKLNSISSIEEESINLLYEKDREIEALKKENESLFARLKTN